MRLIVWGGERCDSDRLRPRLDGGPRGFDPSKSKWAGGVEGLWEDRVGEGRTVCEAVMGVEVSQLKTFGCV